MSESPTQPWHSAKTPFAILAAPPLLWLLIFFLAPLAIIWAYTRSMRIPERSPAA